jgi:hypothetical protein
MHEIHSSKGILKPDGFRLSSCSKRRNLCGIAQIASSYSGQVPCRIIRAPVIRTSTTSHCLDSEILRDGPFLRSSPSWNAGNGSYWVEGLADMEIYKSMCVLTSIPSVSNCKT